MYSYLWLFILPILNVCVIISWVLMTKSRFCLVSFYSEYRDHWPGSAGPGAIYAWYYENVPVDPGHTHQTHNTGLSRVKLSWALILLNSPGIIITHLCLSPSPLSHTPGYDITRCHSIARPLPAIARLQLHTPLRIKRRVISPHSMLCLLANKVLLNTLSTRNMPQLLLYAIS